ncbi:MAG: hypothetical protein ACREQH_08535 [Candidatus Binatus sp.]
MAATLTRGHSTKVHSLRLIDHAKDSEIPGWEVALDRLIGQLVCAFFVAMAVMWVVTTIAAIFV